MICVDKPCGIWGIKLSKVYLAWNLLLLSCLRLWCCFKQRYPGKRIVFVARYRDFHGIKAHQEPLMGCFPIQTLLQ